MAPAVGVSGYRLEWREALDTAEDDDATVTATSRTIGSLDADKAYQWRVRANAANASYENSDFTDWQNFRTDSLVIRLDTPELSLFATTTSSISIRWNAIANAGSYIVRYRINQSGTSFGTSNITQSSPASGIRQAAISGLSSGTSYIIEVVAVPSNTSTHSNSNAGSINLNTQSSPSKIKLDTPTLPNNPTRNVDHDSALAVWNAVTPAAGVGGYRLEWRESLDTAEDDDATVTATSRTIGSLKASTGYEWRVRANAANASYENSDFTDWQSFTTQAPPPPPPKLSTPVLTRHARTHDELTIRWPVIANAGSYIVRYRLNQSQTMFSTSNIVQSSPASNVRQAVISGLAASTSYIIEVVAVPTDATAYSNSDAGRLTTSTDAAPAVIKLATPTFPTMPTKNIDHDSALADWNASTPSAGVRGYLLEWREALDTSEDGEATVTATSRTIGSLKANTDYQWRVTALASSVSYQDSDPSGWQNFKTTKIKLATPVLTEHADTETTLTIRWPVITNAGSYIGALSRQRARLAVCYL